MAKVKFYGLSELLSAIISKCQITEEDWVKANKIWNDMTSAIGVKEIQNFEEEWECFMTIKSYKKIGFDFV